MRLAATESNQGLQLQGILDAFRQDTHSQLFPEANDHRRNRRSGTPVIQRMDKAAVDLEAVGRQAGEIAER